MIIDNIIVPDSINYHLYGLRDSSRIAARCDCKMWMMASLNKVAELYYELIKEAIKVEVRPNAKKLNDPEIGVMELNYGKKVKSLIYDPIEIKGQDLENLKEFQIEQFAHELVWDILENNTKYITGHGQYKKGT